MNAIGKVSMDGSLEDMTLHCVQCGEWTEPLDCPRIGGNKALESAIIQCRKCGKRYRIWLAIEDDIH